MNAVDTNVLTYACDQRDPRKQAIALDLIARLTDGVLLWQVACEFIAAPRKLAGCGFTADDAWDRLATLLRIFPLVPPAPIVLLRARPLHVERRISFWDATIIAAALEAGVGRMYSEDLPGGDVDGLEIVNPFA